MKKLLLLAMVLGLLIAGEVRADGAWVLWHFQIPATENPSRYIEVHWGIHSAYPTFQGCSDALNNICHEQDNKTKEYFAYGDTVKAWCHSSEGQYSLTDNLGNIKIVRGWKCLPESVDPRK